MGGSCVIELPVVSAATGFRGMEGTLECLAFEDLSSCVAAFFKSPGLLLSLRLALRDCNTRAESSSESGVEFRLAALPRRNADNGRCSLARLDGLSAFGLENFDLPRGSEVSSKPNSPCSGRGLRLSMSPSCEL